MNRNVENSLVMGSGCALVGLICGLMVDYIGTNPTPYNSRIFWIFAMVTAFFTGSLTWWTLVERAGKYSMILGPGWLRGVIVGALAGVIGHPVCLYAWMTFMTFSNMFDKSIDIWNRPPLVFITNIWVSLVFTMGSLLFMGIITIPAGAVVGGLLGAWRITDRGKSSH